MQLNPHYAELNESYLFSTIAHKVADYQKAHPEADVIRLGIGDVTLPLAASVTEAMHKAVEEQGRKETFHGYIPSEQGYAFLREAIRKLGDREKRILALRFYDGKTQMEVAGEVGISQAQVSRLEKSALNSIKRSICVS